MMLTHFAFRLTHGNLLFQRFALIVEFLAGAEGDLDLD
jgi:hypothetical protein